MSDAALPTPCSPVSEGDISSAYSSIPNSSDGGTFPFLVHSQRSIVNGESPEVDNGKLTRQKRKRTSPEDQAALEAEYKRNPKPDKAARVDILKRVSLAEKEVQIWFQNRRQNTRRKTRPLLPHEIAAFGVGGMATLSSVPVPGIAHGNGGTTTKPLHLSTAVSEMPSERQERCQSSDESQGMQRVTASTILQEVQEQISNNLGIFTSTEVMKTIPDSQLRVHVQNGESPGESLSESQPLLSSEHLPASLGYLSNRRNARANSLSTLISSTIPLFTSSSYSKHPPPSSCPERISAAKIPGPVSSQVRLALSLNGKAELVSSQVSPPRPQHARALPSISTIGQARPGLKRCQSDVSSSHAPSKSSSQVPALPRISSGRSRDARTWEFCCDTEARDELTTQAENESSGSAIAAISLIRSTSTSNLKFNRSKRNASAPRPQPAVNGKKPKLSRASSSLARLQESGKSLLGSPSGDSDKENWLPLNSSGNPQRRNPVLLRSQKQKRRRVLEETESGSTDASITGSHKLTHGQPASIELDIFKDPVREPKVDQEVDRFMRGEVSPSKKGDLDCIQGLLSLSQGTWR